MNRLCAMMGLAAAGLVVLAGMEPSQAGGRETTFQMRNWESRMVQRYPGDQAFAGGTVRFQGPEKGPYVERCHWTVNTGIFDAPLGLTQRCFRYTLENTPE